MGGKVHYNFHVNGGRQWTTLIETSFELVGVVMASASTFFHSISKIRNRMDTPVNSVEGITELTVDS